MPNSLMHLSYEFLIEYGLSHYIARAGSDFAFEARDLRIEILCVRIERTASDEICRIFEVFPGKIVAFVQSRDNLHKLDRVYVVDRRRSWVVSKFRRVPGQRQNVSDTQGGDPHQFALQTDQILVAATDVEQRHDIVSLLEYRTYCQVAYAKNRKRIVRQSDRIAAGVNQRLCPRKIFLKIERLWGIKLRNHHRLTPGHQIKEACFIWLFAGLQFQLGRPSDCRFRSDRLKSRNRFCHFTNVLRAYTTAAAHKTRSLLHELFRSFTEIIWRKVVKEAPIVITGISGVRKSAD